MSSYLLAFDVAGDDDCRLGRETARSSSCMINKMPELINIIYIINHGFDKKAEVILVSTLGRSGGSRKEESPLLWSVLLRFRELVAVEEAKST
jgi:hypothetical protein